MALKKSMETTSGISLPDAYIKIENTVCIYANEGARINEKSPVDQKYYSFPCSVEDDAPNFIKQGYEYLKSLDVFSEAADV